MTQEEQESLKNKYLPYYRKKYETSLSPAILNFHTNKLFNQAVNTYDPNKAQFQTHLSFYMSKMNRVANNKGALVKETEYFKTHKNKVSNTYHEMKTISDNTPTPLEVSKKTGVPESKVKEILSSEFRVAIVPGVDTKSLDIEPNMLLHGLNKEENKVLSDVAKKSLTTIIEKIDNFYLNAMHTLKTKDFSEDFLKDSSKTKKEIKETIRKAKLDHFNRLKEHSCKEEASLSYVDILVNLDGMASQIYNIIEIATGSKFNI